MTKKQEDIYNYFINNPDTPISAISALFGSYDCYVSHCITIGIEQKEEDLEKDIDFDMERELDGYTILDYRLPFFDTYQTK